MAIAIRCTSCGSRFRAREKSRGTSTACGKCGRELLIDGPRVPDFDVFVSHSTKDRQTANAVVATLEAARIRCWVSARDIEPGAHWGASIIEAISNSRIMVLVYSSNSNTSEQVLREVERAVSKGVTIIPLRIDDTPLSANMEYFISARHWLDAMTPPLQQHLDRLARTVQAIVESDDVAEAGRFPERQLDAVAERIFEPQGELPNDSVNKPGPRVSSHADIPLPTAVSPERPAASEKGSRDNALAARVFFGLSMLALIGTVAALRGPWRLHPPENRAPPPTLVATTNPQPDGAPMPEPPPKPTTVPTWPVTTADATLPRRPRTTLPTSVPAVNPKPDDRPTPARPPKPVTVPTLVVTTADSSPTPQRPSTTLPTTVPAVNPKPDGIPTPAPPPKPATVPAQFVATADPSLAPQRPPTTLPATVPTVNPNPGGTLKPSLPLKATTVPSRTVAIPYPPTAPPRPTSTPATRPLATKQEVLDTSPFTNSLGMTFVRIKPGTFTMGSPMAEIGHARDEKQHSVTLTHTFFMGIHHVTRAQFAVFVAEVNDKQASLGNETGGWRNPGFEQQDDEPVVAVSWIDAVQFTEWLARKESKEKRIYRLPTEAEWEYACRATSILPFNTGVTISTDQANYDGTYVYGSGVVGKYRQRTTPVGSFVPNKLGLYDMHGNAWQWCVDVYEPYADGPLTNPIVALEHPTSHVLRGGAWNINPTHCRSAVRSRNAPDYRSYDVGFRVVLESS